MMRKPKSIKILFLSIVLFLLPIVVFSIYYNGELWLIKFELNSLEDVEVVHIWGHKDITLEEISARIKIGNGEMVLNNLSKDVNEYPQHVYISQIGSYSFNEFVCDGRIVINSHIDIGTSGVFGKRVGIKFNTPADVINNYNRILRVVDQIKAYSFPYHSINEDNESYLFILKKGFVDEDPLFKLYNIDQKYEFAKTLRWQNANCGQ